MTTTYRRRLIWVSDTENGDWVRGHNHVTRGPDKRRDRRTKRREHDHIVRDSLQLYHNTQLEDDRDRREAEHEQWLAEMAYEQDELEIFLDMEEDRLAEYDAYDYDPMWDLYDE